MMERLQGRQRENSTGDRPGISMGSRLPQAPAMAGLQVPSVVRSPSNSMPAACYSTIQAADIATSKSPGAGAEGGRNANPAGLQPRPPPRSKINFDATCGSLSSAHDVDMDSRLPAANLVQQPGGTGNKSHSPHLNHRRTIGPAAAADKQVRSSLQSQPGHRFGLPSASNGSTLDHGGTRSSASCAHTQDLILASGTCSAVVSSSPEPAVHVASLHQPSTQEGSGRSSVSNKTGPASRPRTIVPRAGSLHASSAYQHGDTRASMLRRSASADKQRQGASSSAVSSCFSYSVKRPNAATSATRGSASATLAVATSLRPAPPNEKPRSASAARAQHAATASLVSPSTASRHTLTSPSMHPASGSSTGTSPARRSTNTSGHNASVSAGRSHAKAATSILSSIPERVKNNAAAGMQHVLGTSSSQGAQVAQIVAVATAEPVNKPAMPRLSLNLAAVKPVSEPMPEPSPEKASDRQQQHEGSPGVPAVSVPKLNLSTLIQSQAAEQDVGDAYVLPQEELDALQTSQIPVSMAPKKSSGKASGKAGRKPGAAAPPPEPEQDHYYFYPKLDPEVERQTLDLIARMPRPQAQHFRKIFTESIQAKQNCEAIAFRGHRLLDQLNSHHKLREKEHEENESKIKEELETYKAAYAAQQMELQQTRHLLDRERAARMDSTPPSPWTGPGFESLTGPEQELLGNTLYEILGTARSAEPTSPHGAAAMQDESRALSIHETSPIASSARAQHAMSMAGLDGTLPLQAPRGGRAVGVPAVPHTQPTQQEGAAHTTSGLQHEANVPQLHLHAAADAVQRQPAISSFSGADATAEGCGGCDQDTVEDGACQDEGLGSLLLRLRKDIRHSRVSDDLAADVS